MTVEPADTPCSAEASHSSAVGKAWANHNVKALNSYALAIQPWPLFDGQHPSKKDSVAEVHLQGTCTK